VFKRLIDEFKEPIYRKDLLHVIGYGLLYGLLFAVVFGIGVFFGEQINIYLGSFGIDFTTLFSLMIAILISRKINNKHTSGHIAYRLISVLIWFITYWILNVSFIAFHSLVHFAFYDANWFLVYFPTYFNPIRSFGWIWDFWVYMGIQFDFLSLIMYLTRVLMFIFAIIIMYRNSSK